MSGTRPRPGVHLVTYEATRGTPSADLADAFAAMVTRALEDLSWQDRGSCTEIGDDFWFPERGEPANEAKRICMSCEVRLQCLEYALDNHEPWGIWGGLSSRARRRILSQREGRQAA